MTYYALIKNKCVILVAYFENYIITIKIILNLAVYNKYNERCDKL